MDRLGQIDRIATSETFRGSESLRQLLRYLAEKSLNGDESVKEYQIAIEAMDRSEDFDPRTDSGVRVKVGRLRAKLDEYYAQDGQSDPWLIEIPKGSYRVTFERRPEPSSEEIIPVEARPERRRSLLLDLALSALAASAVTVLFLNWTGSLRFERQFELSPPVERFWQGVLGESSRVFVLFSNARFVGDEVGGFRYHDPEFDSNEAVVESYTGIGEVIGVHELSRVFYGLERRFEVKRSLRVDWEEARDADIVFVGGPFENLPLNQLGRSSNFVFRRDELTENGVPAVIVNQDPQAGEEEVLRSDDPLAVEFAVVRLVEGFQPNRRVLVLAGTRTLSTQAAVEYVSRPESLKQLTRRLKTDASGRFAPFEAALRVRINDGVPVESEIVAFHDGSSPGS